MFSSAIIARPHTAPSTLDEVSFTPLPSQPTPFVEAELGLHAGAPSTAGIALAGCTVEAVRMTRVRAIQQALAAGTYAVPASAVADKIIEHLLG